MFLIYSATFLTYYFNHALGFLLQTLSNSHKQRCLPENIIIVIVSTHGVAKILLTLWLLLCCA